LSLVSSFIANQTTEGEALENAVRNQVEALLSREHLPSEPLLVSQMNTESYIPIATVASLCTFSQDVAFIAKCMANSTTTSIDPTSTLIKPNWKIARNTIILRDLPQADTEVLPKLSYYFFFLPLLIASSLTFLIPKTKVSTKAIPT
jgi:hypothetical protein